MNGKIEEMHLHKLSLKLCVETVQLSLRHLSISVIPCNLFKYFNQFFYFSLSKDKFSRKAVKISEMLFATKYSFSDPQKIHKTV